MQKLQLINGFHHAFGSCWIISVRLCFPSTRFPLQAACPVFFRSEFPWFSVLSHFLSPTMLRTLLHFPSLLHSKSITFPPRALKFRFQFTGVTVLDRSRVMGFRQDSELERFDGKRRCCSTKIGVFQQVLAHPHGEFLVLTVHSLLLAKDIPCQ